MRIALAGAGAFGIKHLDGLKNIDGVTITSIVSRRLDQAEGATLLLCNHINNWVSGPGEHRDLPRDRM